MKKVFYHISFVGALLCYLFVILALTVTKIHFLKLIFILTFDTTFYMKTTLSLVDNIVEALKH